MEPRPSLRSFGFALLVMTPLLAIHLKVRSDAVLRQQQANREDTVALMEAAFSSTSRVARDWGQRDDAYRFALGRNPGYVHNNLETGALFDAGAIMVMLRPDGKPLLVYAAPSFRLKSYAALIRCAQGNRGPFDSLRSTIRVACQADNGSLYLGTATPVSNNTATAPSAGTVVMFDPLMRGEYKDVIRRRLQTLRQELIFVPQRHAESVAFDPIQPLIRSSDDNVLAMRQPSLLPILGRSLVEDLPLLAAIPLLAIIGRALALLGRRRRRIVLLQAERQANHRIRRACRQLDGLLQGLWPSDLKLPCSQAELNHPDHEDAQSSQRLERTPSETEDANQERNLARVTERVQQFLRSASSLALLDPLTQLANRRYFMAQVTAMAARYKLLGQAFALLFVDVDKFKIINDTYGHTVGDAVLVSVSQRLQSVLMAGDFIARYGGDELAVILDPSNLPGQSQEALIQAARARADAMVNSLMSPVLIDTLSIAVSISIGISLVDPDDTDISEIIQRSDLAMYQAKRSHHRRVIGPEDVSSDPQPNNYDLFNDLMLAIRSHQLQVFFQPIVNAEGGWHGFEALARWHHPQRGWVEPLQFLDLAEQHRQTHLLVDELIRMSMHGFQQLNHKFPGLQYYLNLVPHQLLDPQLAHRLLNELNSRNLRAESLTLELTEHSILEPRAAVGSNLQTLRQAGMNLALDDFGTGYSSLVLLKTLRPDVVKIDKSFIQAIRHDSDALHIITLIASLAPRLDLELIAEGLEDRSVLSQLIDVGISLFQGFEFGQPAPLDDWLAKAVTLTGSSQTKIG